MTVRDAIPTIETERLILRGHRPDDLPACAGMWAHPVVTRFIGGNPSTRQQTWSRMLQYAGLWALAGFGYWAVVEKASGDFAGDVGFADFRRDIAPSMRDVPELGWALVPSMHGRGYATEAVRAAVAWGEQREWPRTVCLIDPENLASIGVANKCGYREFERAEFNGREAMFFERGRAS